MLGGKQKQYLRGLAHNRKPVIAIGQGGLTESVVAELKSALAHHELLKVKLPALPRKERQELVRAICAAADADEVQCIGRVATLYRPGDQPLIDLP